MVPARTPNPAPGGMSAADGVLVVCTKADDAAELAAALKGRTVQVLVLGAHEPESTAGGDANQRKGFPAMFYRTELIR